MNDEDPDFDYGKSALIVYNMQKGNPTGKTVFPKIVPNIKKLIEAAREKGRPVIYGQHISLPYEYQSKYYVYWIRKSGYDPVEWSKRWSDGAPGTEIIDELAPTPKDHVVKKYVASFFVGTNAEQVLKNKKIETIILTGVTIDHGIESTARHASFIGLMPVIVSDAVGNQNEKHAEASLTLMRDVFDCSVKDTDYVVNKIRNSA